MYAGTTLRNKSGRLIGAHQKIDRVARRGLELVAPDNNFPKVRQILDFEGKNGPDGIKRKSPAQDEPWHFYNPEDAQDDLLLQIIERHSKNLSAALRKNNVERASFEAAWLAHAIVDGLTPAHHYPFEDKLVELRGEGVETRTSIKDKLIVRSRGDSHFKMLAKNWEFWGAKGVMTSHLLFEWGIATAIAPMRLRAGYPNKADVKKVMRIGTVNLFKETAAEIHKMDMYHRFINKGWTNKLANEVRGILVPSIIKIVALAWYEALENSKK